MEKNIFQRGLPEFEGVERLIVVNQFARIQTKGFIGAKSDIGANNNAAIRKAVRMSEIVIIGWGTSNKFEERKQFAMDLLRTSVGKRLFRTSSHPSRGRYAGFITPIDA